MGCDACPPYVLGAARQYVQKVIDKMLGVTRLSIEFNAALSQALQPGSDALNAVGDVSAAISGLGVLPVALLTYAQLLVALTCPLVLILNPRLLSLFDPSAQLDAYRQQARQGVREQNAAFETSLRASPRWSIIQIAKLYVDHLRKINLLDTDVAQATALTVAALTQCPSEIEQPVYIQFNALIQGNFSLTGIIPAGLEPDVVSLVSALVAAYAFLDSYRSLIVARA